MKIVQSVGLCQTPFEPSLDIMSSLGGLLRICDVTSSHVSPITPESRCSQHAPAKPSNRQAFVRDEHRIHRVFEMGVCGPRNTVEATGKVLECLDSVVSSHDAGL